MTSVKMDSYSLRLMINIMTFVVPFGAFLARAQECNSAYTCHYADVESVSPLFREFQRPGHHSCLTYCTQDPNCVAVTLDRTLDICRLHFEADDIACMQIVSAPGKSLWVINHQDDSCYKVTRTHMHSK